jgi:hypothetical protein
LPQHFEDTSAELGHLVEKENAVMRETDFARTGILSAANQRNI